MPTGKVEKREQLTITSLRHLKRQFARLLEDCQEILAFRPQRRNEQQIENPNEWKERARATHIVNFLPLFRVFNAIVVRSSIRELVQPLLNRIELSREILIRLIISNCDERGGGGPRAFHCRLRSDEERHVPTSMMNWLCVLGSWNVLANSVLKLIALRISLE